MAKSLKEILTSIADKIREATHADPAAPAIEDKMSLGYIDDYALDFSYEVVGTAGYQQGEEFGFGDGFSTGWYENEKAVISELVHPIQQIEDYGIEKCTAEDSGGQIQYIDENIPVVYENGKQKEWSDFWNSFQNYGNDDNYRFAFYNWTDEMYNPKYPIMAKKQNIQTFYYFRGTDTKVDITISGTTTQFFNSAAYLETIRKLIVDETVTYSTMFNGCDNLANVTFEGVIANDIDIHWSPLLTRTSIENIVNHLSSTASGKTLTLNETAVNTAFGINVNDESTFPVGSDFYNLRHSKDNWAFNYLNV